MVATVQNLKAYLAELEGSAAALARNFDPPEYIDVNGFPEFRHRSQDDILLSHLKCVRGVSTMNAAVVLLEAGYFQEVGALCRCADEFVEDVVFLCTALGEDALPSKDQRKMVEDFFQEEFIVNDNPLLENAPRDRVSRDRIRAAIARIPSNPLNAHDTNLLNRALAKSFSGYVHGAYVHIMEMYGGSSPERCRYHISGMLDTPRVEQWVGAVSNYVYRTGLALDVVARRCKDPEVTATLGEARKRFEHETGLGQGDPNELLRKNKRR